MRRREFIAALGGAAAWPLVGGAQQQERTRRIGVLMGYAESDLEAQVWVTAFVQEFKELGWIAGRNVSIDYRFGAGDATDRTAQPPFAGRRREPHLGDPARPE